MAYKRVVSFKVLIMDSPSDGDDEEGSKTMGKSKKRKQQWSKSLKVACLLPLLAKAKALLASSSLVQQQPLASLFLLKYHHLQQRSRRILMFPSYLNREDEEVDHIKGLQYFVISY
jgi:hypothetical protein